mmetsp:Transcript_15303/g.23290  ORF Transcript_15303/g.23290 Transcript_15303/m.23290 type:complete len:429 (+) Transcript_15303:242-1528(+)
MIETIAESIQPLFFSFYPTEHHGPQTTSPIIWMTIWQHVQVYYLELILFLVLSIITFYRREWGSNHEYIRSRPAASVAASATQQSYRFIWDEDKAEELLEGVGHFSGPPLVNVMITVWSFLISSLSTVPRRGESEDDIEKALLEDSPGCLTRALPGELQVNVLTFLHPRDVLNFASVSRQARNVVNGDKKHHQCDLSSMLWRSLWERDYAWLVREWAVGKKAMQRTLDYYNSYSVGSEKSFERFTRFNQEFYFAFSWCYTDYVLAGENVGDSCLVGLHGCVYDITAFLELHPGSPDTVMVEAGRDASYFFEDVGHSLGARKFTSQMCILVDRLTVFYDGCGVSMVKDDEKGTSVPLHRCKPRRPSSLERVRDQLLMEQKIEVQHAQTIKQHTDVLGDVRVYYDPFLRRWAYWYTTRNTFEPVFTLETQ